MPTFFLDNPPFNTNERNKLYDKEILQCVLLGIDAVSTEDEVLRGKKKQLSIDAQFALEQLDQLMKASSTTLPSRKQDTKAWIRTSCRQ